MKQIKQETGRSMVEMLGVLAVIGVLSVGGISGYTLAMNKHRANNVAADLMKRAVVVSAQRQLGQDASLNGFNNQVGDYTTDNQVGTATEGKFSMTVQAVPEEVCEKILALDWDNAAISPDTAEGCNGGDMTFTYNNDLSPVTDSNAGGSTGGEGTDTPPEQTCEEGSTGNGCQKCENGELVADTAKDGYSCDAGVCTDGTCGCPDGRDGEAGELIGGTCCWRGMKYSIANLADPYTDWDPQVCGCPPVTNVPEGGTPLTYNEEHDQCCVNGYSYDKSVGWYATYNPGICGCPYAESDSNVSKFEDSTSPSGYLCCLNNWLPWSHYEYPDYYTQKGDGYHVNTEAASELAWGCHYLSQQ